MAIEIFEDVLPGIKEGAKRRRTKKRKLKVIILQNIKRKKTINRKIKLIRNKKKLSKRSKKVFIGEKYQNSFLDFIKNSKFIQSDWFKREAKLKRDQDNYVLIEIPKVFSLIYNPEEALEVYEKIFKYGTQKSNSGLNFNHYKCEELDIGASVVMDVFVIHMMNYHRSLKRKLGINGTLPNDKSISELLFVSGLLKHIQVSKEITKQIHQYKQNLKVLELIRGGQHSITMLVSKSMNSQTAATKVIEYIDECLRTQERELSIKARRYFSHLICEVIDNCINHSGPFSQWFVLGHFDTVNDSTYGECNLVLFNFGHSIYEGMKSTELTDTVLKPLTRLTKKHTSWFKGHWDEETLWTLYALQEGVSRLKANEGTQKDRGVGTVKLINAFQQFVCKEDRLKPVMSIISGNTYILFNNKYLLEEKNIEGTDMRIIAFNKQNDLNFPPDEDNVRKLEHYFPGTIISMKFYLDKDYIEDLLKKGEEKSE